MFEGMFSPTHLIIVLLIVFFLFGAKKLPELGKSLGTGIREFKNGVSELHADMDPDAPSASTQTAAAPAAPAAADVAALPAATTPPIAAAE
jgi:sec-independent protein translocase protein TatA